MLHQWAHLIDVLQAEAGEPVAIYGEGKEHAMAIGITKMSTKEMREINKGHGVDVVHYLNDGLWKTQQFAWPAHTLLLNAWSRVALTMC